MIIQLKHADLAQILVLLVVQIHQIVVNHAFKVSFLIKSSMNRMKAHVSSAYQKVMLKIIYFVSHVINLVKHVQ